MRMKRNKKILSIFVLLIVFAFIASFFSMVAFNNKGSEEEQVSEDQQFIDEQVDDVFDQIAEEIEEPSDFIKSVQASMVVSDDEKDTAQSLVNTLNIYNALDEQNKVVSFDGSKDDFSSAKQGLKDMDIYFDDIESSYEKSIWALVVVDENGVATLN